MCTPLARAHVSIPPWYYDEPGRADWQVKPHCRPSEVANGPWADAAGSMRRGWPRPGGVAEIVYENRGVFDK